VLVIASSSWAATLRRLRLIHLRKHLRGLGPVEAPWAVRHAGPDDSEVVLALLTERAHWLRARGIHGQWPAPFPRSVVQPALDRRRTWLVEIDGAPVATFALEWEDDFWPDADDDAGYLHRLAVRPGHPGLGARVLHWVADYVRAHGRAFLRLDCVASNPALCRYYAEAGFSERGTVTVHGFPGDRRPDAPAATVQRYELPLGTD